MAIVVALHLDASLQDIRLPCVTHAGMQRALALQTTVFHPLGHVWRPGDGGEHQEILVRS